MTDRFSLPDTVYAPGAVTNIVRVEVERALEALHADDLRLALDDSNDAHLWGQKYLAARFGEGEEPPTLRSLAGCCPGLIPENETSESYVRGLREGRLITPAERAFLRALAQHEANNRVRPRRDLTPQDVFEVWEAAEALLADGKP